MDEKRYSFQSKLLICLTVAVVATFFGVAVKTVTPVVTGWADKSQQTQSDVPDEPEVDGPQISLDPNLSAENTLSEGEAVFAGTTPGGISYIVYNENDAGYIATITKNSVAASTAPIGAKAAIACLTDSGIAIAADTDEGYVVYFVDEQGSVSKSLRTYPGEIPVYMGCYDGQTAVIFRSEGAAGKRIVFRLYDDGSEICERYSGTTYEPQPIQIYRIGNNFTVFFRYRSQFTKGGGYAVFSTDTVSVIVAEIERSSGYDFLSVIPSQSSYAMLCSDAEGAFIMQLDQNMQRSKKYQLTNYSVNDGKLSFDGKNYYAFVGGATEGRMFRLEQLGDTPYRISAYDDGTAIAGEYNTGGALLHLMKSKTGFFLTDTNGLFTKKVTKPDAKPIALLKTGGSAAAVCNIMGGDNQNGENGAESVYIALFN